MDRLDFSSGQVMDRLDCSLVKHTFLITIATVMTL
jgi:hypothetical protein